MRRYVIFTAVLCLFLLTGCHRKPLSEEEVKEDFCISMYQECNKNTLLITSRLLEETEKALDTTEFIGIWGLQDAVKRFDKVVSLKTADGTVYYALMAKVGNMHELVRIRKDNVLNGEVVWINEDIDQKTLEFIQQGK